MKFQAKKLAPFGLYLAILAALAGAGIYTVQPQFGLPVQISLGLVVIGLAMLVLLDPQRVKQALTGRQARYGSNALLLSIAFIGIVVVINVLAANNSRRWDLTEDKTHSLSKESLDTLKSLKSPVTAEAFFSTRNDPTTAKSLLDTYKYYSNGKFDYTLIDPEKEPARATADKVTTDGTIVLKQSGRMEQVSFAGEQDITNALIRLANPGKRAVYFLIGHGEYSPDDSGDRAYDQAKQSLTAKNYTVSTLSLLATHKIPEDALALIVAGSQKPVSTDEVNLIQAYLDKGGSLVLLSEPIIVTQFGDQPDPLAAMLEKDWGIKLGNNIVIDLNYNPPVVAVSASYGQHAITSKMNNLAAVFPSARTVDVEKNTNTDIQTTVLVQTANNSWGETDFKALQQNQINFDAAADQPGPVSLAVAAVNNKTTSRVVVIGDSDFASSKNYTQYGNGDFLMNSIDWAAKQDSLISLTPKTNTQRTVKVLGNVTLGLIMIGTIFVLPGLVIVSGVYVWIQRKRRG